MGTYEYVYLMNDTHSTKTDAHTEIVLRKQFHRYTYIYPLCISETAQNLIKMFRILAH